MMKKRFNKNNAGLLITVLIIAAISTLIFASVGALTDTARPKIVQISPGNNELNVATHDVITVKFSKPMDASTINENTFTIVQRTTPGAGSASVEYRSLPVKGMIKYDGLTATFIPNPTVSWNPLQPSQIYGNVFTVTVTTGAKDLEGNSLSQNYIWSFCTGDWQFYQDTTTSQTKQ